MSITVVPFREEHETAVKAFNRRLQRLGSEHRFSEDHNPPRLVPGQHESLFEEYFVALDTDDMVRGAYVLKHQDFFVNSKVLHVANYTYPLSEGIVDRRYSLVGLTMLLDAQRRLSCLFDLGLGSLEHPSAQLQKGIGWSQWFVPFYFYPLRPARVLRNLTSCRRSAGRRVLLDLLAVTGVGWTLASAHTIVRRCTAPDVGALTSELVEQFGPWADELWEAAHSAYSFAAVRDRRVLNHLYQREDERFLKLKASEGGRLVGWAVLIDTQMRDHKHFGNLRVGTIADCFATPDDAGKVVRVATRFLAQRGVDLIVSNQTHAAWGTGLAAAGFFPGPSNFVLSLSKALSTIAQGGEDFFCRAHFNRGDGDGPIHL